MRWAFHAAHQRQATCSNLVKGRGTQGAGAGPGDQSALLRLAKRPTSAARQRSDAPPLIDGYGVLVHSASGHDADTVIVDGKVVLAGGGDAGG